MSFLVMNIGSISQNPGVKRLQEKMDLLRFLMRRVRIWEKPVEWESSGMRKQLRRR